MRFWIIHCFQIVYIYIVPHCRFQYGSIMSDQWSMEIYGIGNIKLVMVGQLMGGSGKSWDLIEKCQWVWLNMADVSLVTWRWKKRLPWNTVSGRFKRLNQGSIIKSPNTIQLSTLWHRQDAQHVIFRCWTHWQRSLAGIIWNTICWSAGVCSAPQFNIWFVV